MLSGGLANARTADITAPEVGAVTPGLVGANVITPFSADFTDNVGVKECLFLFDGRMIGKMQLSQINAASGTSGAAKINYVVPETGEHRALVVCSDNNRNVGNGTETTLMAVSPLTVGAVAPVKFNTNTDVTFSAEYQDIGLLAEVKKCTFEFDGTAIGAMTLIKHDLASGTATLRYRTAVVGPHQARVTCEDDRGNVGQGPVTSLLARNASNIIPPTVSAVSPTSAVMSETVTLSADYSDDQSVMSCNLIVNGSNLGAMDLSAPGAMSGTASFAYVFTSTGDQTAQVVCLDDADNSGTGALTTIAVTGMNAGIYVGQFSPTSVNLNSEATFTASYEELEGAILDYCAFYADYSFVGPMTITRDPASSTGTVSYTIPSDFQWSWGNYPDSYHYVYAECADTTGRMYWEQGSTYIVLLAEAGVPTVSLSAPSSVQLGQTASFTVDYSDDLGIVSCSLFIDDWDLVTPLSMELSDPNGVSGTATYTLPADFSWPFGNSETYHYAMATCTDVESKIGSSYWSLVMLSVPRPTVGPISPTSAPVGTEVTISADYSDQAGVVSCDFYADYTNMGPMTLSAPGGASGTATYVIPADFQWPWGNMNSFHYVAVVCSNASGASNDQNYTYFELTPNPALPVVGQTELDPYAFEISIGVPSTVKVDYADDLGVTECIFIADYTDIGPMTLSAPGGTSGVATYVIPADFQWPYGNDEWSYHYMQSRCSDADGNSTVGSESSAYLTRPVDYAPSAGTVEPTLVVPGRETLLSAPYSDYQGGVTACEFVFDDGSHAAATLSAPGADQGIATLPWTFSGGDNWNVYVVCTDTAGQTGQGELTTISTLIGPPYFVDVPTVFPASVLSPVLNLTVVDDSELVSCTASSHSYNEEISFATSLVKKTWTTNEYALTLTGPEVFWGAYQGIFTGYRNWSVSMNLTCTDALGRSNQILANMAYQLGTDEIQIGLNTSLSGSKGVPKPVSVSYSAPKGIYACRFYASNAEEGRVGAEQGYEPTYRTINQELILTRGSTSGTTETYFIPGTYNAPSVSTIISGETNSAGWLSGTTSLSARCVDLEGNMDEDGGYWWNQDLNPTAPVLSDLAPAWARIDQPRTFTASYSDDQGVTECWLDSNNSATPRVSEAMTLSDVGGVSGTASVTLPAGWSGWTGVIAGTPSAGSHYLPMRCKDADGLWNQKLTQIDLRSPVVLASSIDSAIDWKGNNVIGAAPDAGFADPLVVTFSGTEGSQGSQGPLSQAAMCVIRGYDSDYEYYLNSFECGPEATTFSIDRVLVYDYSRVMGVPANTECSIDGGDYLNCRNYNVFSGLSLGQHVIELRITTPPSVPQPTDRLECSLDGAEFSACASPMTIEGLTAGTHTYQVRAFDEFGTIQATPASMTWIVDMCPPSTSGSAGYQGCSIGIKNTFTLEKLELSTKVSVKTSLWGVRTKLFDYADPAFQALSGKNQPDSSLYPLIYQQNTGRIGGCTSDATGTCYEGVAAPGHYLVIARYFDGESGKYVYVGKDVAAVDFVDMEAAIAATITKQYRNGSFYGYKSDVKFIVTLAATAANTGSVSLTKLAVGDSLWKVVKHEMGTSAKDEAVKQLVRRVAEINQLSIPEWGLPSGTREARSLEIGTSLDWSPLLDFLGRK